MTPQLAALPDVADLRPLPRPPLHPLETSLVGVTALHLAFLPWALGTMHTWSQLASLGLGLIGFLLMLLPRRNAPGPAPLARVLGFPVFWAGLVLMVYLAVQAGNPAWRYINDGQAWWLEPLAHIRWLPSGVAAPLERSNPLRALLVFASLWLVTCSVWGGLQRRRSYRALFGLLAANSMGLALFAVLQHLSGTDRIFWTYLPSNDKFIGSFIYPNHAGPYFNLMLALACGQAWWSFQRARDRTESSAWAVLFTVSTVAAGTAVIYTGSKLSIVLMMLFSLIVTVILSVGALRGRRRGSRRTRVLPVILALGLALAAATGVIAVRAGKVWERFTELASRPGDLGRDRRMAREATVDMMQERWLFGWGAGCFRHCFPLFVQHYPAIYRRYDGVVRYWEHAHSDALELMAEVGMAGTVPVVVMLGSVVWQMRRRRIWTTAVSCFLVLGCGQLLVHSLLDFVFHNPAVLLTWGVLCVAALRWPELDPSAAAGGAGAARPNRAESKTILISTEHPHGIPQI